MAAHPGSNPHEVPLNPERQAMAANSSRDVSRRAFTLSMSGAIAAFALTACGGSGSNSGSSSSATGSAGGSSSSEDLTKGGATTITMWVDQNRQKPLEAVAKKFKDEKGVTVKLVVKDNSSMRDDFITQAPTGKGPDVIVGAHDWIGALVQNGVVEPLELGDKSGDFSEAAVAAVTYDGKTWGVPYSVENIALLRNTELVDSTPEKFDDMVKKGQEVVDSGKAKYGFVVGLDPVAGDPYHLYPFQTSMGAPVFEQKEDGSYDASKVAMGGEKGEAFAKKLAEHGPKGTGAFNPNMTGDIAKEQFFKGQAAYFLTGPWNVEDAEKAGIDFAVEPIPAMGDQDAQPFIGVNAFFVSSESKNKLAANEFVINYLSSEQAQDALYTEGKRAPALTASFDKAAKDEVVKAFGEIGKNGVPMPADPEMGAVWEFWGGTEMRVIKGEADPAADWKKMVSNIEGKIKK